MEAPRDVRSLASACPSISMGSRLRCKGRANMQAKVQRTYYRETPAPAIIIGVLALAAALLIAKAAGTLAAIRGRLTVSLSPAATCAPASALVLAMLSLKHQASSLKQHALSIEHQTFKDFKSAVSNLHFASA